MTGALGRHGDPVRPLRCGAYAWWTDRTGDAPRELCRLDEHHDGPHSWETQEDYDQRTRVDDDFTRTTAPAWGTGSLAVNWRTDHRGGRIKATPPHIPGREWVAAPVSNLPPNRRGALRIAAKGGVSASAVAHLAGPRLLVWIAERVGVRAEISDLNLEERR